MSLLVLPRQLFTRIMLFLADKVLRSWIRGLVFLLSFIYVIVLILFEGDPYLLCVFGKGCVILLWRSMCLKYY